MATPRVITGNVLPMTAPVGGVTAGVPLWINGLFVVPNVTAAATERFAGEVEGVFELTKAAGFALAEGEACYFDDTAKSVKAAAAGYALIGHCVTKGGAASAATTVHVRLQQAPIAAAGAAGGEILLADPGDGNAIPVAERYARCAMTSGAVNETRTVAAPGVGEDQRLRLVMDVDGGGDIEVTFAAAFDAAGNTKITFGDPADYAEVVASVSGGADKWQLVADDGVALS